MRSRSMLYAMCTVTIHGRVSPESGKFPGNGKIVPAHPTHHECTAMANIDLSDYNLGELKGLQFEIENELRMRRLDEVTNARAQILAVAHAAGVSVEDLLLNKAARVKRGT